MSAANNNDLEPVRSRVKEKLTNYRQYKFTRAQNNLLKCFFDLAQEFDSIHDLYRICVVAPFETLGLDCALYLLDNEERRLELVCTSREGVVEQPRAVPPGIHLEEQPYTTDDSYLVPIYRKPLPQGKGLDTRGAGGRQEYDWQQDSKIIGILEVQPLEKLSEDDRFFFTKYANRIGYRLHNRKLARQNIHHLEFINSLVVDIEHNVIIPNMYFRYLFNKLKKKIIEMESLEREMAEVISSPDPTKEDCLAILEKTASLRKDLNNYHLELKKHHANISLFLESLFRREHFQRGHLVLHPKNCLVEKDIIIPQLENYKGRLEKSGVTIESSPEMAEEEFPIMVDLGLLSQVYANLFSNAVKYTETVSDHRGRPKKALAYGRELLIDCFGPGRNGVKFNVFTSGLHLASSEIDLIFSEGGRGANSPGKQGTGHGLAFIKHVIEMHGGRVGYEPTREGNNFFFILPLPNSRTFSALDDSGRGDGE